MYYLSGSEPKHYVPIIPMILVNGAEGTIMRDDGTAIVSRIPKHNPHEIISNIYRIIDAKEPTYMVTKIMYSYIYSGLRNLPSLFKDYPSCL